MKRNRKKGELFKMISKVDEDVLFKRFEAAENVLIPSMHYRLRGSVGF